MPIVPTYERRAGEAAAPGGAGLARTVMKRFGPVGAMSGGLQ